MTFDGFETLRFEHRDRVLWVMMDRISSVNAVRPGATEVMPCQSMAVSQLDGHGVYNRHLRANTNRPQP